MKYYILDLTPDDSLVKDLVGRGSCFPGGILMEPTVAWEWQGTQPPQDVVVARCTGRLQPARRTGPFHRREPDITDLAGKAPADPQDWLDTATEYAGLWWPCWAEWLGRHSVGKRIKPPPLEPVLAHGRALEAPGTYVHQR